MIASSATFGGVSKVLIFVIVVVVKVVVVVSWSPLGIARDVYGTGSFGMLPRIRSLPKPGIVAPVPDAVLNFIFFD